MKISWTWLNGTAVATMVLAIIWTIVAGFIWGIGVWTIGKDTDRILERAQIAAEAGDMYQYMVRLRDNMQEYGMTEGNTAFVFKTDMNDIGLQFRAVNKLIERLEMINELDKSSTAYQTALDDIRGTLREMPRIALGWYYIKTWWILALITIVAWLFTGIAWLKLSSSDH